MPISMYDTRTMMEAIKQMLPPKTFFKSTYFSKVECFDTEFVDLDFYKGKRRMAPFVSELTGSKTVARRGYETRTYTPPLIGLDTITTSGDLKKRSIGEAIYGGLTPEQRASKILASDLVELNDMITRREEWMCREALYTGKITMIGDNVKQEIDFKFDNKITPAKKWGASDSDPLKDLKDWSLQIQKESGFTPDRVIMSSEVVAVFLDHPKVKDKFDTLRYNLGAILPTQNVVQGSTYHGKLLDPAIEIYSYNEWYPDETTKKDAPLVPEKTVLMSSSAAKFSYYYGCITLVDQKTEEFKTFVGTRIPDSWIEKKPPKRFVQVQSRPVPIPHYVDSWVVATVL